MAILLCERCLAPIDPAREGHTTFAHIDHARPDGSVRWVYTALHTAACGEPARERSAAEPPHTGEWDPARRGHSPAAAAWIARRSSGVRAA